MVSNTPLSYSCHTTFVGELSRALAGWSHEEHESEYHENDSYAHEPLNAAIMRILNRRQRLLDVEQRIRHLA